VVRLSSARAHRAVAGSSTWPSSVMPRSSALISCSSGFHRSAAAVVGSARAASLSAGDSRTLPAVEHSTRPDSSGACRLASQLGDHAAHGIPHRHTRADAEHLRQRGDVVGAVLEPEPRATRIRRHAPAGRRRPPGNGGQSGAKTFPQFSSAVTATPWISMSVSARRGPGTPTPASRHGRAAPPGRSAEPPPQPPAAPLSRSCDAGRREPAIGARPTIYPNYEAMRGFSPSTAG
jgi:hypothetical protein